ncbi:hypothetical protein [Kroppenstedtia eburnea]|uniref:hypothetical protein n=1 Tax=Kroppenstedtia eburnea TaxID=714067 RepID=UPI0002F90E7B|nr:hypothetical protein [Kroppenstedtia eburnea]QKI83468.1 hypothetical protein GXN75_16630 [Kroppenstedtia eburnea]
MSVLIGRKHEVRLRQMGAGLPPSLLHVVNGIIHPFEQAFNSPDQREIVIRKTQE